MLNLNTTHNIINCTPTTFLPPIVGGLYVAVDFISGKISDNKIIICSPSEHRLNKISFAMKDCGQKYHIVKNISEVKNSGLYLAIMSLQDGYQHQDKIFIPDTVIFGKQLENHKTGTKIKARKFADNFEVGDYVIHRQYGVGIFGGLEMIGLGNQLHECVKITYLNNNKLFVPVETINQITKYSNQDESEVVLDNIGSVSWERKRQKAQSKINELAYKIIEIAAARKIAKAEIYNIEERIELIQKMERDFPHTETEDQEAAIMACLEDLQSGKAMDRIVCGDVGFGKTEVAIRAIFLVTCGKIIEKKYAQVGILCPTTFLAEQHYNTLKSRFDKFKINIALLTSNISGKKKQEIYSQLANGTIDIVVATHSIFSEKITFKNLNLVICDEEQSFGVEQKEKLKKLGHNCHMITLSATPIPRTLHSALSGIRETSYISTPPYGRLPIKTQIIHYNSNEIKAIIQREISRGGQCIIVTPKIIDMDALLLKIADIFPEEEICLIHGKQQPKLIHSKMELFYQKKIKIIIATTIIATGIDFSNSNTIIINRAEMFGMAQLYQIRGRVGRRDQQAHCYFLVERRVMTNDNQKHRLKILEKMNYFGCGIEIANMDLELRGGGNILGKEQSGAIDEIGFDLYTELLTEAVNNGKITKDFIPDVQLSQPLYIPNDYIASPKSRISIYRQIAAITSPDEAMELRASLTTKFGTIPKAMENIFDVVNLREFCLEKNITKIHIKQACLQFSLVPYKLDMSKLILNVKNGKIQLINNETLSIKTESTELFTIKQKITEIIDSISLQ